MQSNCTTVTSARTSHITTSNSSYNSTVANGTLTSRSGPHSTKSLLVGLSVSLVLLAAIAVILFILHRKGKFRPSDIIENVGGCLQSTKMDRSKNKSEDNPGPWRGRRRSDKVAICRDEISQNPTGVTLGESPFCQSIEEDQSMSYTLGDDAKYDALNNSASRRIATQQADGNYHHVNRLPPDLEGDYDSADANALFPKRGMFERPMSDSHNTYSHLSESDREEKKSNKAGEEVTYVNSKSLTSEMKIKQGGFQESSDPNELQIHESRKSSCEDETFDDGKNEQIYDDEEIYDTTAVAEILQQRSQLHNDPDNQ